MNRKSLRIVHNEEAGMYGLHEVEYSDDFELVAYNPIPLTSSEHRDFRDLKSQLVEAYARPDLDPATVNQPVDKVSPEEEAVRDLQERVNNEAWNYFELRASVKPPFEVIVEQDNHLPGTGNPVLRGYYEGAARGLAGGWDYQIVESITSHDKSRYRVVLNRRS